jgi:putative ABC transport system permease protein
MSRPPVTPDRTPPKVAAWLAVCRLPVSAREFVRGDLDEEFHEFVVPARGLRAARRWYWLQAIRCFTSRPDPSLPRSQKGTRMSGVWHDVRFALRLLRRVPGFTAAALLTLALGIGVTTALFSVVHAVLFGRLPFANVDRVVVAMNGPSRQDGHPNSFPQFLEWRDAAVFEDTAGWFSWNPTLTGAGEAEELTGLRVSASLFSTLGIRPIVGTAFAREDESRSAEPKVLIGEGMWRRRFGAQPDIVGRRLTLSGVTFTIVGVAPGAFRMRPSDRPPDVIGSLRLTEALAPASLNFMTTVARLRPGQTVTDARDRLQAVTRQLHPTAEPPPTVTVVPAREMVASDSRTTLLVLLAAVGFLLLITCANLANLLLARAMGRRQEIGVRLALGAGRARVVRQLLTESVILSLAGGLAGIALAWIGVRIGGNADVVHAAGAYDVRLSLPVLAFAVVISAVAGLLFGFAPAFDAGRQSMRSSIGDAGRVVSARSRLRAALVVAEVSLTLVLLVGAGLLIRSFTNILVVDKGFSADRLLSFSITLPDARYPTAIAKTQALQAAIERLSALPGVTAVGLVNELPLDGSGVNGGVTIQGQTFPPGKLPAPEKRIVSPDYFRAMGIRLISGRTFTDRDATGATPVMVVSEGFAKKYFAGRSAIGEHAGFNWDIDGVQEIVGVVADVHHYGLDEGPDQMVYVSYLQRPLDAAFVVVKAASDASALTSSVRQAMLALDRDRPLVGLETMDSVVSASVATRRFALILASAFAGLGVLLAATGVYGVVSYGSRQRSREFGIRIALGATSSDVVRLVVRQGLWPVAVGLAIGLGGALALTKLIQHQLFGVTPSDPATFATVGAGLALIAVVACYVPARRAVAVDAAKVLRGD